MGAACTVPASPELVTKHKALFTTLLEKRESEVFETLNGLRVGNIIYTLMLSAKPTATVEVRVMKDAETNVQCVGYADGLSLSHNDSMRFDATNWNIPQTVHIDAQRHDGVFQGSSTTRFVNFVTSNDPDWASPFLRPMVINFADDDSCVHGAQKYDEAVRDRIIRKCGCAEGFFIDETDPLYCNSVTKCEACPEGMACGFQQNAVTAIVAKGYYHRHNAAPL